MNTRRCICFFLYIGSAFSKGFSQESIHEQRSLLAKCFSFKHPTTGKSIQNVGGDFLYAQHALLIGRGSAI